MIETLRPGRQREDFSMPAPVPPKPPDKKDAPVRSPTRLEFADEIQAAIRAREAELAGLSAPQPEPERERRDLSRHVAHAPEPAGTGTPVQPYRPSLRPPTPVLVVFDDGGDEGQTIRLRGDRFVIGRSEGDLLIPHDGQISGRHAELVRHQDEEAAWLWTLTDLNSTNGSFVRAGAALLKDGQEFLIGRTRYRLEANAGIFASGDTDLETPAPSATASARPTVPWISASAVSVPSIVELTSSGPGSRVSLVKPEYWIGSDRAACEIAPTDDPFVSPRHARVYRDSKGRWHVGNNKSANGVWVRVEQMDLTGSCFFQIGEQRFAFKVPRP
jgi:pSer/pThr/pTyr-binding forkhead associated (FHA) protein